MSVSFTPWQLTILRLVQAQLPSSLTPYADLGELAGVGENDVINFLSTLKLQGMIRRFGASLSHGRTNWQYNIMVAWTADETSARKYAPLAAEMSNISHIYFRPSPGPIWPYSLYTMIHGRGEEECTHVVQNLLEAWPLHEYILLPTLSELKKSSMTYF